MTGLMPLVTPSVFPTVELTYSSDTADVDLFLAAGSPVTPIVLKVTVEAAADIYASTTSNYAMDAVGLPVGSRLELTVDGRIVGQGGAGGSGGHGLNNGNGGSAGGPALRLGCETNIDGSGDINGGGGGGGGGGGARGTQTAGEACNLVSCTGGTGGQGQRYNGGPNGGAAGSIQGASCDAGNGGSGGGFGSSGASGQGAQYGSAVCNNGQAVGIRSGGGGGSGGKSIEVNGQSYTNTGVTLRGTAS